MLAHNSQEIAEAYEKLEILSKNPKKRIEYEARKMQLLDDMTQYASAIAEGEHRKALAMAKNLKKLGVPTKTIMEASGLSIKEIEEL